MEADTIAALSALHRGLWVGLSAFDENESAYSDICTRMFDIREQASHLRPTSDADVTFLVYVRSWYSANQPDHIEVIERIFRRRCLALAGAVPARRVCPPTGVQAVAVLRSGACVSEPC
jgi:hypothetical protein